MDTRQLTTEIARIDRTVSGHTEQIRTLFEQQKEIKDLTKATNSLAISVEKLADKVMNVDERLDPIEKGEKQKRFEIWKAVVPTMIVGIVSFLIARLLG